MKGNVGNSVGALGRMPNVNSGVRAPIQSGNQAGHWIDSSGKPVGGIDPGFTFGNHFVSNNGSRAPQQFNQQPQVGQRLSPGMYQGPNGPIPSQHNPYAQMQMRPQMPQQSPNGNAFNQPMESPYTNNGGMRPQMPMQNGWGGQPMQGGAPGAGVGQILGQMNNLPSNMPSNQMPQWMNGLMQNAGTFKAS